jgi:hypothetical protein
MAHDALAMVDYGAGAAVLVIADSDRAAATASAAAVSAGLRVADQVPIADSAERLNNQAGADLILLAVDDDHGPLLDRLLDRLGAEAHAGRFGSVIAAPIALIDPVAARTTHRRTVHICEPSEADWADAIAVAAEREPSRLHDSGKGQLAQLSEEVGRIAGILASLSEGASGEGDKPSGGGEVDAAKVRATIRARRLRDQFFRPDLFADPAWDMLLDLMAARLEGQRVAVSSLCIAAAVPPTTALRWIRMLTEQGLLVRVADQADGRRVYIEMSPATAAALGAYLKAAQRLSPIVV